MQFHMRIGEVSLVSVISNRMSRCSRWPVGDRGPSRPLGPMHTVTLFPPLATPLNVGDESISFKLLNKTKVNISV